MQCANSLIMLLNHLNRCICFFSQEKWTGNTEKSSFRQRVLKSIIKKYKVHKRLPQGPYWKNLLNFKQTDKWNLDSRGPQTYYTKTNKAICCKTGAFLYGSSIKRTVVLKLEAKRLKSCICLSGKGQCNQLKMLTLYFCQAVSYCTYVIAQNASFQQSVS